MLGEGKICYRHAGIFEMRKSAKAYSRATICFFSSRASMDGAIQSGRMDLFEGVSPGEKRPEKLTLKV
jgi:hypothetical protein